MSEITKPKYQEPIINENGSTSRAWWRFFDYVYQSLGSGDGPLSAGIIPTGSMITFAVSTLPDFYLLCDGSSKLVADFPDLFDVIGFTFGGSGDNFNVPTVSPAVGFEIIKT